MPTARNRIAEKRRAQIISGALNVFSEKGFSGATTKDIAQAAGIQSTGLIYHYFPDKATLLLEVLQANAPPLQLLSDTDGLKALPVHEGLAVLGNAYLEIMSSDKMRAAMRVLIGEALRDRQFAQTLGEVAPLRILRLVTDYIRCRIEAGDLTGADPRQMAWTFMGGLFVYVFAGGLLDFPEAQISDRSLLVKRHVDLFINGAGAASEGGHLYAHQGS